jgi:hypothetical protein
MRWMELHQEKSTIRCRRGWRCAAALDLAKALRSHPVQGVTVASLVKYGGQQIGDRALLNQKSAIHIGFAEFELVIEQDTARPRAR